MITLILCATIVKLRKEDFVAFLLIIMVIGMCIDAAIAEMITNTIKESC